MAVDFGPSGFVTETERHDLIFHDLPTGFSTKIAEGSNLHRLSVNDNSITYTDTENHQIFMINGFSSPRPVLVGAGESFAPDPRSGEIAGIILYRGQLFHFQNGQGVRMTSGPGEYFDPEWAFKIP